MPTWPRIGSAAPKEISMAHPSKSARAKHQVPPVAKKHSNGVLGRLGCFFGFHQFEKAGSLFSPTYHCDRCRWWFQFTPFMGYMKTRRDAPDEQ